MICLPPQEVVSILMNTAVLKKLFATILKLLLVCIMSNDSWWGPPPYNQHPVKSGGTRCFGCADVRILKWHMTTRSKSHVISGRDLATLSYHPAMYGGHRCCGRAYIRFFICCVIT